MLRPAVAALALLLALPLAAHAYKPAPIRKPITYADAAAAVKLVLAVEDGYGPAKATVTSGKLALPWPKPVDVPATAVVTSWEGDRVVLLGGYGNPGVDLGKVQVFDMKGKLLQTFDLRRDVAGLEGLSKAYRKVCCPFPWVHAAKLAKGEAELHLDVCAKLTVVVDLKQLKVRVLP